MKEGNYTVMRIENAVEVNIILHLHTLSSYLDLITYN